MNADVLISYSSKDQVVADAMVQALEDEKIRFLWGQVCIASRGKVKKLCMDADEGIGADVYIHALQGSGGDSCPPDGGWGEAPVLPMILARAYRERNRARAANCIRWTRFPEMPRRLTRKAPATSRIRASLARRRTAPLFHVRVRASARLRCSGRAHASCA